MYFDQEDTSFLPAWLLQNQCGDSPLEEMKMLHTAGESFQKEVIIDRRSDMTAILTAMWTLADVGIKLQMSDRLTDERTTRRGKRAWFVASGNTPVGDPFFKFM